MGRKRGQRNAAREKAWPGQDAAEVRAFHESQGEDELREKTDAQEPLAPSIGLTGKQLVGLRPASEVARAVRLASAAGTYVLPPLKRRNFAAVGRGRRTEAPTRSTPKEILGDLHWSNIGRAHYLILLLQATNHYALPQFMHECDPLEIMEIAERMDLWKATVERMHRKAA